MSDNIFIHQIKVRGLLSFGPSGIDLPLGPLNVLIGPNGSGKSNLLDIFSLLRAAPTNILKPIASQGGFSSWAWRGDMSQNIVVEAICAQIRHEMSFHPHNFHIHEIVSDIKAVLHDPPSSWVGEVYYLSDSKSAHVLEHRDDSYRDARWLVRDESILSQVRDPERYPELNYLQENYEQIKLYRSWTFGPEAAARRRQPASGSSQSLMEDGSNLALVLNKIRNSPERYELLDALRVLLDGVVDLRVDIADGHVQLMLEESSDHPPIPASRLSDGTLRYLHLIAALLQPSPPPLMAIEEPELGLHPDMMQQIAKLLIKASARTQLVITTHSRGLVDALQEVPEALIICERRDGESSFERLEAEQIEPWLEKYTLGQLWRDGELGGNRW